MWFGMAHRAHQWLLGVSGIRETIEPFLVGDYMASTRPGLVFEETFDTIGSSTAALDARFTIEGNYTPTVVDIAGRRAAKISLNHQSDSVPNRTELQPNPLPTSAYDNGLNAHYNETYWTGMRMYMPSDWSNSDSSMTCLIQWHDQRDAHLGEAWKNPNVSLMTKQKADGLHFIVIVRADADSFSPSGSSGYDINKEYDIGLVGDAIGNWTSWVWRTSFDYDSDGQLSLWRNGEKVLDLPNQANAFNDQLGPYFKFGLYKWDWASSKDTGADSRTVYFDDVRIAHGPEASYASVDPDADTAAAPAPSQPTPAPSQPTPAPSQPAPGAEPANITVGSGPDSLVLKIAQDAWNGDARYTISVDGQQVGGTLTAKAAHAAGQTDLVTVKGDWGNGPHQVSVNFLNDAWGGTPETDRNLYVEGASYNGAEVSGAHLVLTWAGALGFSVAGSTSPHGSDYIL